MCLWFRINRFNCRSMKLMHRFMHLTSMVSNLKSLKAKAAVARNLKGKYALQISTQHEVIFFQIP